MAGANRKKPRTPKTSKGINGAKRHPLSEVMKALLGKGMVARFKEIEMKASWRGAHLGAPYNSEQAELNRSLYPHLFPEDAR